MPRSDATECLFRSLQNILITMCHHTTENSAKFSRKMYRFLRQLCICICGNNKLYFPTECSICIQKNKLAQTANREFDMPLHSDQIARFEIYQNLTNRSKIQTIIKKNCVIFSRQCDRFDTFILFEKQRLYFHNDQSITLESRTSLSQYCTEIRVHRYGQIYSKYLFRKIFIIQFEEARYTYACEILSSLYEIFF